jgi:hypothetical protein
MHMVMCVVLSAVVIPLCRAIRVVCLHDVSMIAIGVEGAEQVRRNHLTTTWHLGCPYPIYRHIFSLALVQAIRWHQTSQQASLTKRLA